MIAARSASARIGSTDQAPSARSVTLSAVLTLLLLVVFGVGGWLLPVFMFFAVGAGAGYALSGSV